MKANELMCGNLVCLGHNDLVLKILGIDGNNNVVFTELQGSLKLQLSYDIQEIKPIPLTKEILEKNGFVYKNGNNCYILSSDCLVALRVGEKGELLCNIFHYWKEIKYVHQLQNLLCNCEYEELANNFKM